VCVCVCVCACVYHVQTHVEEMTHRYGDVAGGDYCDALRRLPALGVFDLSAPGDKPAGGSMYRAWIEEACITTVCVYVHAHVIHDLVCMFSIIHYWSCSHGR